MTDSSARTDQKAQLNVQMLVYAYTQGIFPMADPDTDQIYWYSPDPRGIIPLDRFHVTRSLRRVVKGGKFAIKSDENFTEVMRQCAAPRPDEGNETWINAELISAYTELHTLGLAHSVEAYVFDPATGKEILVGGLYGVAIRGAFFGESMFHRSDLGGTDSSKVCLVHLVNHLRKRGFVLLDTQFVTDHLARFGCVEIMREEYLSRLKHALEVETSWWPFEVVEG